MRTYTGRIDRLSHKQIFVFGSNTEGRHGKGAAKKAMKFGAVYGKAIGLYGQTYAIITKDLQSKSHPSIAADVIERQIESLYYVAKSMWLYEFLVVYNATGANLNGYSPREMATMFNNAGPIPENMVFEEGFAKIIESL